MLNKISKGLVIVLSVIGVVICGIFICIKFFIMDLPSGIDDYTDGISWGFFWIGVVCLFANIGLGILLIVVSFLLKISPIIISIFIFIVIIYLICIPLEYIDTKFLEPMFCGYVMNLKNLLL